MKKQIIHAIAFIAFMGALGLGNQTVAFTWQLLNLTNYTINADVSLSDCGEYSDLGVRSIPAGGQASWLGTGGTSGCEGTMWINDYVKADNLGNVQVPGASVGGQFRYNGIESGQLIIYQCTLAGNCDAAVTAQ